MTFPIIQAAGIIDKQDAEVVINSGFNYLGFPFRLDYNAEDLSESQAKELICGLPKEIKATLITYLDSAREIEELCNYLGCAAVQIHGKIELDELLKLRETNPKLEIIKSLIFKQDNEDELILEVKRFESIIDAFITDTYNPETGASGATGKTHDWSSAKNVIDCTKTPFIIAGGLTPCNIYDAVTYLKPAGVDSHTGLEDEFGKKSQEKCEKFVSESMRAWRDLVLNTNS